MIKKLLAIGMLLISSVCVGQNVHSAAWEVPNVFTNTNQFTQGALFGPLNVGALPAASNGTIMYASDAVPGSNPCSGGGAGAFAFRTGGAWACAAPGAVTGVSTTAPISVSGGLSPIIGLTLCPNGQVYETVSGGWQCAPIGSVPAGVAVGSVLVSNGSLLPPVYQAKPAFDIRDFGCVGNGSADDTTCVQNWLNSAGAAKTTGLFCKAGTYKYTSQITYTGAAAQGMSIVGEAVGRGVKGCVFQYAGAAGGTGFYFNGLNNAVISNIYFDGGQLAKYVVWFDGTNDTGGPVSSGIALDSVTCGNPQSTAGTGVTGSGCLVFSHPTNSPQVSEVKISHSVIQGSNFAGSNGILVRNSGNTQNYWLDTDSIVGFEYGGFFQSNTVVSVRNSTFASNTIADINSGASNDEMIGNTSEGSAQLFLSTTNDAHHFLSNNHFASAICPASNPPGFTGGYVISSVGRLTLIGNELRCTNTGSTIALVQSGGTNANSSVESFGNFYQNASGSAPIFDGSNNLLTTDSQLSFGGTQVFDLVSVGDKGGPSSGLTRLERFDQSGGSIRVLHLRSTTVNTAYPANGCFLCLATSDSLNFRNAANTADVNGVSKNSSDVVLLGGAAGIGTTGPTAVGGSITFGTGLGAISQLVFPSDQSGKIATQNNNNLVFAPNGTGTVNIPYLSIGQPLGINSTGQVQSTPLAIDASRFTGATVDVLVNTCLGYVYSMLGNLPCDTRAIKSGTVLLPNQTVAAEIDANEPPAPTCSVVSGGTLASGTFHGVYTLVSTYGESAASNECTVTTSGTCPGSGNCSVQINSPPFPGIATSFNTKLTAGASWTEKDCGVSPAIGSNATITTTCGGTNVSHSNTQTELILPPTGGWNCTITDGTSYCLKFGDRSFVHGSGNGEGQRFAIETGASANVGAIIGSDLNTKNAAGYLRIENVGVQNTGGTIVVAAFSFQQFFDSSECKDIDVVNNNSIGALINNGGAGSHCDFLHAEGSSGSGARPMVIGGSGGVGFGLFTCFNCVAVHPGSGFPAIEIPQTQSTLHFAGSTYMEGNTPAGVCIDATTPFLKAGTTGNVGGLIIDSIGTAANCTTSTSPIIELENHFTATAYRIESIYSNRPLTLINDLSGTGPGVTCPSAPCFYAGSYRWSSAAPANFNAGIAQPVTALSKQTACSAALEGVYWIVNNCSGACSAGTTSCTTGGTTHCEMRCNGTNYIQTGR